MCLSYAVKSAVDRALERCALVLLGLRRLKYPWEITDRYGRQVVVDDETRNGLLFVDRSDAIEYARANRLRVERAVVVADFTT